MTFEVIPAIDLSDGRLARLEDGKRVPVDSFGGDALAAAATFAEAGARWIHVVDMDLAFTGASDNELVVRRISELAPQVQASGGIASKEDVEGMLEAGASRVVLGSAALADRAGAEQLIDSQGERLAIGLEVDAGRLVPRSRGGRSLDLEETLLWLAGTRATRFVRTSVGRVGELSGPDLDGIARLVSESAKSVIAAGGIATVEDLRRIKKAGAEGAILGRALQEGAADLSRLLREIDQG